MFNYDLLEQELWIQKPENKDYDDAIILYPYDYLEQESYYMEKKNDKPIYEGRFNLGAISLHFPMIVAKAKQENRDFYETRLDNMVYVLDIRDNSTDLISKEQFDRWSTKKCLAVYEISNIEKIEVFKYNRENNMDDWIITDNINNLK